MRFSALLILFTSVVSSFAERTVADAAADIAKISAQATNLDNSINAFPSSAEAPAVKLTAALAIHNVAVDLKLTIDDATSGVHEILGPVSEPDAQKILDSLKALEPTIEHALTTLADRKPKLPTLPIDAISKTVQFDLASLHASIGLFADALLAAAPSDSIEADAIAFRGKVDAAFTNAQAVFA